MAELWKATAVDRTRWRRTSDETAGLSHAWSRRRLSVGYTGSRLRTGVQVMCLHGHSDVTDVVAAAAADSLHRVRVIESRRHAHWACCRLREYFTSNYHVHRHRFVPTTAAASAAKPDAPTKLEGTRKNENPRMPHWNRRNIVNASLICHTVANKNRF